MKDIFLLLTLGKLTMQTDNQTLSLILMNYV